MEKAKEEIKEKGESMEKKSEKQEVEEFKNQTPDKTKESKEKLEKTEKLAERRLNQLKYLQADIENLRKRFEKERSEIIRLANKSLIRELLVVLDSFDAAIKVTEEGKNKKGLLMLEKEFFDILADHGLKEIEALGKKFNPKFHEALCKEFSKKQDNEIITVIQKGYLINSEVIRASKVKVSKGLKKEDKLENNKENWKCREKI